jgi:hypothetical protein
MLHNILSTTLYATSYSPYDLCTTYFAGLDLLAFDRNLLTFHLSDSISIGYIVTMPSELQNFQIGIFVMSFDAEIADAAKGQSK